MGRRLSLCPIRDYKIILPGRNQAYFFCIFKIIMKTKTELIRSLRSAYFWDTDRSDPESELSDRLIIERVFNLGDLREIKMVIDHFGEKRTTEVLISLNYMDPKTLNFISKLFNKPRKRFKCYTRRLSITQPWN